MAVASALLAGVLTRFGMDTFAATATAPALVLLMLASYLLARRFLARYAVVIALAAGVLYVAATGRMAWHGMAVGLAEPVFTMPSFSWGGLVSLALPLFIVTMASQNLPGAAVIRASGYPLPISRLITMTGVAGLVLAPFGAFARSTSVPSRPPSAWGRRRTKTAPDATPRPPAAACSI